jgi:hypothetical protein
LATRHGAYSVIQLGPRAQEIADEIREILPVRDVADEAAVRLVGLCLARIERAAQALDRAKPRELARLEADTRGWVNSSVRLLDALGATPLARARLGLTLVRAREITDRPTTDLSALSEEDLASLRVLLSKAEADDA